MRTDPLDSASHARRSWPPTLPNLRLPMGRVLLWTTAIGMIYGEYRVLRFVLRVVPRGMPLRRVLGFLYFSPRWLFLGFAVGAIVAVVVDFVFRGLVRPMMVRWYNPLPRRVDDVPPLDFHFATAERVEQEIPARLFCGRMRVPGRLILTNRRVWFFPYDWGTEPASIARDELVRVAPAPTSRRVLGLVRGYPDHIEFEDVHGETFSVVAADPGAVVDWFRNTAHHPFDLASAKA